MPELPEVEMTARLLGGAISGAVVESVSVPGAGTLRSFDPPITELEGRHVSGVSRRGKHLLVEFADQVLLLHLMSAGRLQVFDRPASPKDRRVRLAVRFDDGSELRLREFGTRQSAWVKLIRSEELNREKSLATLGPEAWPDPPDLRTLLTEPRPLSAALRDQRVIAGIGRSWVDEIMHEARLSPFKRGDSLTNEQAVILREAIVDRLGHAVAHYQEVLSLPLPDKFPMPLRVHGRSGEPCPRCGETLRPVHYEDHVLCYCPACQTEGKVLKDRRFSRFLK